MVVSKISDKFILLSKIAKENKYAQEYLGLLARRGDLGSIRIGKRWYTTREWFEEFQEDAKAKKEEARIIFQSTKATQLFSEKRNEVEEKIEERLKAEISSDKKSEQFSSVPLLEAGALLSKSQVLAESKSENMVPINISPAAEVSYVQIAKDVASRAEEKKNEIAEVKINVPAKASLKVGTEKEGFRNLGQLKQDIFHPKAIESKVPVRNIKPPESRTEPQNVSRKINLRIDMVKPGRPISKLSPLPISAALKNDVHKIQLSDKKSVRKSPLQGRKRFAVHEAEAKIAFEKSDHNFSPSFLSARIGHSLFLPKFAFASAVVLLFVVLSGGTYLYNKDSLNFSVSRGGEVAGAQDTRMAGISSFNESAIDYFERGSSIIKENISLSRVLIEAAIEKNTLK